MARIIHEFIGLNYDKNKILEAKQNNQPLIVKGVLQRAEAKNANKRVYPRSILEREIKNYQKLVNENRALGELDHADQATINLQNVSHIVKEVWWEGNDVCGSVEILSTPKGQIARQLMEAGVTLGISSRGVGETKKNDEGCDVVDESFMLICFDLVSEPSTHNAFLFREGKEVNINEARKSLSKTDRIYRIANDIIDSHESLLKKLKQ